MSVFLNSQLNPESASLNSLTTCCGNLRSRRCTPLCKNLTLFFRYLIEKITKLFSLLSFSRTKETQKNKIEKTAEVTKVEKIPKKDKEVKEAAEVTKVEKTPKKDEEVKEVAEAIDFAHLQTLCSQASKFLNQRQLDETGPVQKLFGSPEIVAIREKCAGLITELIIEFTKYQKEFEAKKEEAELRIAYRDPVPAYFANIKGSQSSYQRKYLALAGIRNLIHFGPQIIDDFAQKLFLGQYKIYDDMRGLKAYKTFTGNTFDLDLEFDAKSDEEAIKIAEKEIQKFMSLLGLQEKDRKARLLDIQIPIPQSNSHTERSHTGLWKRNVLVQQKVHYYVNVPNLDLALFATLTMPYQLAEMVAKEKQKNGGTLKKEFLDALFHNGISDMCFNDKAATLGSFYANWKSTFDSSTTSHPSLTTALKDSIERGDLGKALKETGFKIACEQAYTRDTLIEKLEQIRGEEDWKDKDSASIVQLLSEEFSGNDPKKLYHTDNQSNDYAPLSKGLLENFIKTLYKDYVYPS